MTKKLAYVQSFTAENGTQYNYLRFQQQPRVELPKGPASGANFMAVYKLALKAAQAKAEPKKERPARAKKNVPSTGATIRDRVNGYLNSAAFKKLAPSTQYGRRRLLVGSLDSKKPSWVDQYGDAIWDELTPKDFKRMLHARAEKAGEARNWLNAIRAMVKDLLGAGEIELDPTWGIRPPKSDNPDGFKTWEPEYLQIYREYWPSGTPQRLALEVLYCTGGAISDAVKLSRDNFGEDGSIQFDRQKTGVPSCAWVTSELEAEMIACKLIIGEVVRLEDGVTIDPAGMVAGPLLRTGKGKRLTSTYLGNRVRVWAQQAGVPAGYSAHGIRKRAVTDDAEDRQNPATNNELKAKYGWRTNDQPDRYTRAADSKRISMARAARLRKGTKK
jgi:site-specific recombinase XerC